MRKIVKIALGEVGSTFNTRIRVPMSRGAVLLGTVYHNTSTGHLFLYALVDTESVGEEWVAELVVMANDSALPDSDKDAVLEHVGTVPLDYGPVVHVFRVLNGGKNEAEGESENESEGTGTTTPETNTPPAKSKPGPKPKDRTPDAEGSGSPVGAGSAVNTSSKPEPSL